jgi:hypothetical protein
VSDRSDLCLWPSVVACKRSSSSSSTVRPLSIFYSSRDMSIPVFIPVISTLALIQSSNISSVGSLLDVVWEKYSRLDQVRSSQLSLHVLVSYLQTYAFQLRLTPHRRIQLPWNQQTRSAKGYWTAHMIYIGQILQGKTEYLLFGVIQRMSMYSFMLIKVLVSLAREITPMCNTQLPLCQPWKLRRIRTKNCGDKTLMRN